MKAIYKIKADTERKPLYDLIPMDTPMRVCIEAASACNFHCNFCCHNKIVFKDPEKRKNINQIMSIDMARKCIEDLGEFPEKIKRLSFYANGEPLLNTNLPEIILYAKQHAIANSIDITTNVSLLSCALSDKLIDSGVDKIFISLYGLSDEQYEKTTGMKVKFEKIVQNIRYLYNNRGTCKIHIKICDAAFENSQDEAFFHDTFSGLCDLISVEHVIPYYMGVDYEDDIMKTRVNLFGQTITGHIETCPQIFYTMIIHPSGTVSPCLNDWKGEINLGDVNSKSLKSIWNGKQYYELGCGLLKHDYTKAVICKVCMDRGSLDYACLDNIDLYRDKIIERYIKDV
jgi:MoaA/NifB/PqqE/SkfB family radical SAM enzyme